MNYAEEQAMKEAARYKEQQEQAVSASTKLSEEQVALLKRFIGHRDELEEVLRQLGAGEQVNSLVVGVSERGGKEGPIMLLREENRAMLNVAHGLRNAACDLVVRELEAIANEVRAIVRN